MLLVVRPTRSLTQLPKQAKREPGHYCKILILVKPTRLSDRLRFVSDRPNNEIGPTNQRNLAVTTLILPNMQSQRQ
jgi:hypothetical protein